MERITVGMSGGVDSAVAAYLLKQGGYDVTGVMLRTWVSDSGEESRCCEIDDARAAAGAIGIPFHVVNCTDDFARNVTAPFIRSYINGLTPNPCIVCNRCLKWEKMLYMANVLAADRIATGHYASVVKLDNGRYTLRRAKHARKDQTYMLYALSQEQLSKTVMPLGEYSKEEVRDIAHKTGIPVADKADSQEICFVPDDDYAAFIRNTYDGDLPGEGNFTDEAGNVLGRHKGIINYTVGQRKGLGISLGHPMYVKRIDPVKNEVILAEDEALYSSRVVCKDVNYMGIPSPSGDEEFRCLAKIRYRHEAQPATAIVCGDVLRLEFDEPVRAATPGQSAVLYDDKECVIGGGVIV